MFMAIVNESSSFKRIYVALLLISYFKNMTSFSVSFSLSLSLFLFSVFTKILAVYIWIVEL